MARSKMKSMDDGIDEDEITLVCHLIATGQTYVPVPRCGRILLACIYRGLIDDPTRPVPTLTPAGWARGTA